MWGFRIFVLLLGLMPCAVVAYTAWPSFDPLSVGLGTWGLVCTFIIICGLEGHFKTPEEAPQTISRQDPP